MNLRKALRAPRVYTLAAAAAAAMAFAVAAPASRAATPPATPPLYVANEGANTVSVIDATKRTVNSAVTVGSLPQAVVLSPDGSTAYVVNYGSGTVSVIDTRSQTVTSTLTVGQTTYSIPEGLALSPDGSELYVTYGYRQNTPSCPGNPPPPASCPGSVAIFNTANLGAPPTRLQVGDVPMGIAVTPDGTKAYVADSGSGQVTEIEDLNSSDPKVDSPIEVGGMPAQVAVTPGGKTVYVTNSSLNKVSVIDAASGKLTATLSDSSFAGPIGVATSPNGGSGYVANFDSTSPGELSAIDTVNGTVSGTVKGLDAHPYGVAYSPDGKTAYVTESNASTGSVRTVDTQSGTVSGGPINVDSDPLGLAVAPDQAPKAALTVTPGVAGQPTYLDASDSTPAYSGYPIVSYAWNFGDGSSQTITCDPPKTTCTQIVKHTYAKPGSYTASVTETDSAGTSTTRVFTGQMVSRNGGPEAAASQTFTVQAAQPVATPSPTSLDFGTQTIFWSYPPKAVTLSNTGNAPLNVSSVGITGTNASDFALDSDACSGHSLPVGASCQVLVRFVPGFTTGTGPKSATLQFLDNAAGSPQSVPLSGISQIYVTSGDQPAFFVSPDRLDFPHVAPGSHSHPQRFTVTNKGQAPMTVSDVTLSGKDTHQFELLSGTCRGATVAPGDSCLVYVEFRPTTFGEHNALVEFDDNAAGSPHIAQVVGTAVGARAVLAPSKLAFGSQLVGTHSSARKIEVTNAGNRPLEVHRTVVSGSGARAFKILTDSCADRKLAPGKSCTIGVEFHPSRRGADAAHLTLADNGAGTSSGVALSGRGIAPVVRFSPVGIAFGSVALGSHSPGRTLTVTNAGDAPLRIARVELSGGGSSAFSMPFDRCVGRTVRPGSRCQLVVAFFPRHDGAAKARLVLYDDAPSRTQSVGLSGYGQK